MPNFNGTVAQVSSKPVTTKFGTKNTYSMKGSDGAWYSFAFKDPKLSVGTNVSFEYDVGTYGNTVQFPTIMIAGAGSAAPLASAVAVKPAYTAQGSRNGTFPIAINDGSRSICRQNALTNARELVQGNHAGSGLPMDDLISLTLATARKFESYTTGDHERMAAVEEMNGTVEKTMLEAVAKVAKKTSVKETIKDE